MSFDFYIKHTPKELSDEHINKMLSRLVAENSRRKVTLCEWNTENVFQSGLYGYSYHANIKCREFSDPNLLSDRVREVRARRDNPAPTTSSRNEKGEHSVHRIVGMFQEPMIGTFKLIPSFIRKWTVIVS